MGYLCIVAAAVLWGTLGPVARFAFRDGIDPLELAFWRAVIGGAAFAAHAIVRRRLRIARRDVPALVAFALVGVTVFYWSYLQAVRTGGAALAAILLYTAPAWVAVAGALWLGERLTTRKLAALVLTLAGVALVAVGGGLALGDVGAAALGWGLLSGVSYAAYYLFGKRYFERYPAPTVFLYALPLGALALLPVIPWSPKAPADWLVILFIAVVPTYLAYLLYSLGLRRIEATRAATVATLEPVVAAVLALVVWRERLGAAAVIGSGLVLAGVLVMTTTRESVLPPHEGPASV